MRRIETVFEVSWEVCNKVGGINTVVSTKAKQLQNKSSNLIMIGPDIWRERQSVSDFERDDDLFFSWRKSLSKEGIHVTIGRWNIPGKPVSILIDFSDLYNKKNEIFKELWDEFKLDSLSGNWDYIEPAIFGYAAGKVIKSFNSFYSDPLSNNIAQFHEWMTGSGVLFLNKYAPHIATVFTTHATLLGRTIAGNNMPFYGQLEKYNPEQEARRMGLPSQYSLEKTAAKYADVFTTVSDITAEECKYLLKREPDFITTNGFNKDFVPENIQEKKNNARKKLKEVTEACLGYEISDSARYIINSGRYEFSNKGIDIFIESLKQLNENKPKDELVAFIMVPADQSGVNILVENRLNNNSDSDEIAIITHKLKNPASDPVLNKINEVALDNSKDSKVKIIFAPVYLDSKDGIFNMSYYDILIGFDLSVFPSYYEPWGYTPMESLAFGIPTITTNLAGFGKWLADKMDNYPDAAQVIDRYNDNANSSNQLTKAINHYLGDIDFKTISENADKLSDLCLWDEMIDNYIDAYKSALDKSAERKEDIDLISFENRGQKFSEIHENNPNWNKIFVQQQLPQKLQPLKEIANNLWWTWNHNAAVIFKSIDPDLWAEVKFNPVALIESLDTKKLRQLENDEGFVKNLNEVYSKFKSYMSAKHSKNEDSVAYFSMEYGIHDTLKIYSGGLGILAGDYIKEASDSNVNMNAVGLLYRYGYFNQKITSLGDQISESSAQRFTQMPLAPVRNEKGEWLTIKISLPTRTIYAKTWKVAVGRVDLYLLDTDIEQNSDEDRKITYNLYGGNSETRLLQELVLGVGGIRMLSKLGLNLKQYHCNEGHAAFIGVERINKYIKENSLGFKEALEVVRASTLFTTHTPVPAGHDRFEEDIIRKYIPHYPQRLQLSWDEFMGLGRVNKNDHHEKFNMSNLAARLSSGMNGVSKIHGRVSREMFNNLYPAYYSDELHISHITNGVHLKTWLAKKWYYLFEEKLGTDFFQNQQKQELWDKFIDVSDKQVWELRNHSRKKLIDYVKSRIKKEMTLRSESPQYLNNALYGLGDDVLTIGFARRFATYKRAHLLFKDLDKLAEIVNEEDRPVQFLFAGKAHPADQAGKDLIKRIVEITKMPRFAGKIIFLENYDIALGKRLVQGVDVWLNNPTRPMEASGTSGEKAAMNGVLNLSVLDGWWAEGYKEGAGWALSEEKDYESQEMQDSLDSSSLYFIIQEEIKPTFYQRANDIPEGWVKMIKSNIINIAPKFTMHRMLMDYKNKYYDKQILNFEELISDNFAKAKQLSAWKDKLRENWDALEVKNVSYPNPSVRPLKMGETFKVSVHMFLADLDADDIGIEIVFGRKEGDTIQKILSKHPLELESYEDKIAKYSCKLPLENAGVYDFSFRVFPKHPDLKQRMDFPLAKWI